MEYFSKICHILLRKADLFVIGLIELLKRMHDIEAKVILLSDQMRSNQ